LLRSIFILHLYPLYNEPVHTNLNLDSLYGARSHASKRFREVINYGFWNKYNSKHIHQRFNQTIVYFGLLPYTREASPVQVALANYHYKRV